MKLPSPPVGLTRLAGGGTRMPGVLSAATTGTGEGAVRQDLPLQRRRSRRQPSPVPASGPGHPLRRCTSCRRRELEVWLSPTSAPHAPGVELLAAAVGFPPGGLRRRRFHRHGQGHADGGGSLFVCSVPLAGRAVADFGSGGAGIGGPRRRADELNSADAIRSPSAGPTRCDSPRR